MYLPASELQQYRGQWSCPYCVQDMREEDRKKTEYKPEKPRLDVLQYSEQCERCGKSLESRVYIFNGKRLCKSCLEHEQEKWGLMGGGPMGPVQRIRVDVEKKQKERSILDRTISEFLYIVGVKKRYPVKEIVVYEQKMKSEISAAKPMSDVVAFNPIEDKTVAKPKKKSLIEEAKKPKQEGIISLENVKKPKKKKKDYEGNPSEDEKQ